MDRARDVASLHQPLAARSGRCETVERALRSGHCLRLVSRVCAERYRGTASANEQSAQAIQDGQKVRPVKRAAKRVHISRKSGSSRDCLRHDATLGFHSPFSGIVELHPRMLY